MNVLYISSQINGSHTGGAMYSRSNYDFLNSNPTIGKIEVVNISLSTIKNPIIRKLLILTNSIIGYSSQETILSYNKITRHKDFKNSNIIWFDGSLSGKTLAKIKKQYPSKVIVTAFHNIEKDFYNSVFKSWIYFTLKRSVLKSEYLSVKYSDLKTTITNEDGARLKDIYSNSYSMTLPILYKIHSRCPNATAYLGGMETQGYVLFVGSDFPPNVEALEYISNVIAPIISKKVLIVGKGLEKYKKSFEKANVEIVGFVEDISQYYTQADAVITPIFSGAGMKIKVAEALSYGKIVIGTPFSFVGYPEYNQNPTVFKVAESSSDFKRFIDGNEILHYNLASIEYFETHFLYTKYIETFDSIIGGILENKAKG